MSWSSRIGAIAATSVLLFVAYGIAGYYLTVKPGPARSEIASAKPPAPRPSAPAAPPVISRQQQIQESCTAGLGALLSDAKALLAEGDAAMAAARLNLCQGVSNDKTYLALYQTAERKRLEKTAKLEKDEKARKRREGVSIGMSKEDVLASSWGKPQKINTTTTSHATREQWVYGGHNYLYFTDGVLTAVQN